MLRTQWLVIIDLRLQSRLFLLAGRAWGRRNKWLWDTWFDWLGFFFNKENLNLAKKSQQL